MKGNRKLQVANNDFEVTRMQRELKRWKASLMHSLDGNRTDSLQINNRNTDPFIIIYKFRNENAKQIHKTDQKITETSLGIVGKYETIC